MTNAIIMASGMGMRMRPLTEKIPKPLVKVCGIPMIETIIEGLLKREIEKIYVVVGYLGEQFEYLKTKYSNVIIVQNNQYSTVNNISSIYAALDYLDLGNCFICEADLFISDPQIFDVDLNKSCYFGKRVRGNSDDWVFDVDENGNITRIGKHGVDCYNMVGIAYFLENDARILKSCIQNAYQKKGYEDLFWDEVVNSNLDKIKLVIHPIGAHKIVEIDTVAELEQINGGC